MADTDVLNDPAACRACRATGRIISTFGGDPHPVRCPWCEGQGRFIPGHDAQTVEQER